jgi:hypothetical protein
MKRICFYFYIMVFFPGFSLAGNHDTLSMLGRRNVISLNPTPALLFGDIRNITLRYERLVRSNQSIVAQAGWLVLEPFLEDSVGDFFDIKRISSFGLNLAFDYRFYMLKRNKFPAPDGLYIGPYVSYYGFKFKDEFYYYHADTAMQSGNMTGAYNYINAGFEIGYQLILWKRLSIDLLIFGPSLTYAFSKWTVSSNLTEAEKDDLADKLKEKFNEKYPILVPFIDPSTEKQSATFRMLLRYSISIGFHF